MSFGAALRLVVLTRAAAVCASPWCSAAPPLQEAAISSSLSHPNCVATYTYSVEPLRSNSILKDSKSESEGPGAGLSMHDRTQSWRASGDGGLAALQKGSGASGSSDMGAFSWEVRLVQEFCDLGSLRNAFKANRFK